jgi:hypothetical protein
MIKPVASYNTANPKKMPNLLRFNKWGFTILIILLSPLLYPADYLARKVENSLYACTNLIDKDVHKVVLRSE